MKGNESQIGDFLPAWPVIRICIIGIWDGIKFESPMSVEKVLPVLFW